MEEMSVYLAGLVCWKSQSFLMLTFCRHLLVIQRISLRANLQSTNMPACFKCIVSNVFVFVFFLIQLQSVVPFLVVAGVVQINLIVTYVVAVAAGLSVAAAFLLPW